MILTLLHSKLHRACVTHVDRHYEGSLGIDHELVEMAGMIEGQQIDVLNIDNGARFTTYILKEPTGSKKIGVYGAAAHLCKPGDRVIIIAYAQMEEKEAKSHKPVVLILDEKNNVVENG